VRIPKPKGKIRRGPDVSSQTEKTRNKEVDKTKSAVRGRKWGLVERKRKKEKLQKVGK